MLAAEGDLYRILQVDPDAHANVITAAYRALARMLHPDQTREPTDGPMARLNHAYAILRDPNQRRAYDAQRTAVADGDASPSKPAIITPPPHARSGTASILRHGRYTGWSLDQLARRDPDYLRWLARQMSGRQYRSEIDQLLARGRAFKPGR